MLTTIVSTKSYIYYIRSFFFFIVIKRDAFNVSKFLQVRAGAVNLTKNGTIARVSKIFIHENYESRILDNDIAIIQLAGKGFSFSSDIQPVNLSSGTYIKNKIYY